MSASSVDWSAAFAAARAADAERDARVFEPCAACAGSGIVEVVAPSVERSGLAFPCRVCAGVGASADAVARSLAARLAAVAGEVPAGMRAAVVALEGDADRGGAYPALVERSRWNGWARPWFGRVEVERMIRSGFFVMTDSDAPALRWTGDAGEVLLEGAEDGDDCGAGYWVAVPRQVFSDGVERFRVGDGWVWLEVEADDDDDDDDDDDAPDVAPDAARLAAAVDAAHAAGLDPTALRVEVDALSDASAASAIALERWVRAPRLVEGSSFRIRNDAGRVLGVAYLEGGAL